MEHRGRLIVMANVFNKPLGAICNEFHEVTAERVWRVIVWF